MGKLRVRRMSAEDFADFCSKASAKDIQEALNVGAEWDERAFFSAASSNTDPRVIWILLNEARKSSVNLINAKAKNNKQTALHCSAGHNNNPEITKALIAAGASVNVRNAYGQTPLDIAKTVHQMKWREHRPEIIEMLKKAGAV
ncbi:MAG: ankyrin repeat domain-containing protein [Synergistaceae bacterium]|nr:ankyrin repeat domain-containing protein [Synergistaceae bacterium]